MGGIGPPAPRTGRAGAAPQRYASPSTILIAAVIDEATIARAVELLREAAPGAAIILFGSYAREMLAKTVIWTFW